MRVHKQLGLPYTPSTERKGKFAPQDKETKKTCEAIGRTLQQLTKKGLAQKKDMGGWGCYSLAEPQDIVKARMR